MKYDQVGYFGIYERSLLEKATVGTPIKVNHNVVFSLVVICSPEELLQRGELLRYDIPLIVDGKPYRNFNISPRSNGKEMKWERIGSGGCPICYESLEDADSIAVIHMEYILFNNKAFIAIVQIDDKYYLASLNGYAKDRFCKESYDEQTFPLIEYSEAVQWYIDNGE